MDAVTNVLETIKNIIAAFKKFFEDVLAMFQPAAEGDDATV